MILYWYPKCSTCKNAKKYLEEHSISFDTCDIVLSTPNKDLLKVIQKKSGKSLSKLFNTSGLKYRELGLKDKIKNMSDDEMLSLLESDGMLIKRPILITEEKAYIGFKEKEWSEII